MVVKLIIIKLLMNVKIVNKDIWWWHKKLIVYNKILMDVLYIQLLINVDHVKMDIILYLIHGVKN